MRHSFRGLLVFTAVFCLLAQSSNGQSEALPSELRDWCSRFDSVPGIRIQWRQQPVQASGQPIELGGGVADYLFVWPSGFRETIFPLNPARTAVDIEKANIPPNPWESGVLRAAVFGPDQILTLNPASGTFNRYPGRWDVLEHSADMPIIAEWVVARLVSAGAMGTFAANEIGVHQDVYSNASVDLVFVTHPDKSQSLVECVRKYSDGTVARLVRFSKWKPDSIFGNVPTESETRAFDQAGREVGNRMKSSLVFIAAIHEPSPESLSLDLKSSRTVDRARGVILDSKGEIVAPWRGADSASESSKWWLVLVLGVVAAGAVAFSLYYLKRRSKHGA